MLVAALSRSDWFWLVALLLAGGSLLFAWRADRARKRNAAAARRADLRCRQAAVGSAADGQWVYRIQVSNVGRGLAEDVRAFAADDEENDVSLPGDTGDDRRPIAAGDQNVERHVVVRDEDVQRGVRIGLTWRDGEGPQRRVTDETLRSP